MLLLCNDDIFYQVSTDKIPSGLLPVGIEPTAAME